MIRLRKKRSCYRKRRDYEIVKRMLRQGFARQVMHRINKPRAVMFMRAARLMFNRNMIVYNFWRRKDADCNKG